MDREAIGSLTFPAWHAATRDLPGHVRSELFGRALEEDQRACWDDLLERTDLRHESEYLYELRLREEWPPPKRHREHHGTPTSTSTGTMRVEPVHGDPLKKHPGLAVSTDADRDRGVVQRPDTVSDAGPPG